MDSKGRPDVQRRQQPLRCWCLHACSALRHREQHQLQSRTSQGHNRAVAEQSKWHDVSHSEHLYDVITKVLTSRRHQREHCADADAIWKHHRLFSNPANLLAK
jgi:hypothetical protein